jgi:hypothetical protein
MQGTAVGRHAGTACSAPHTTEWHRSLWQHAITSQHKRRHGGGTGSFSSGMCPAYQDAWQLYCSGSCLALSTSRSHPSPMITDIFAIPWQLAGTTHMLSNPQTHSLTLTHSLTH